MTEASKKHPLPREIEGEQEPGDEKRQKIDSSQSINGNQVLANTNTREAKNETPVRTSEIGISSPFFFSNGGGYNRMSGCCIGFPCLHFGFARRRSNFVADTNGDVGVSANYDVKDNDEDDGVAEGNMRQVSPVDVDSTKKLISEYLQYCSRYACPPNAGVLVALRFHLPTIRVSGGDSFHDSDLLALTELLLSNQNCNNILSYVRRLDFSVTGAKRFGRRFKGFGSHGAFALGKVIEQAEYIQEVFVSRNRIGPYGAAALFLAASRNKSLKTLVMRKCRIGERGAFAFCEHVTKNAESCGLRQIDLSVNRIGFIGEKAIRDALTKRYSHYPSSTIHIDLDGNLAFQEIMNGVTHGIGIMLCTIGTAMLSERVKHKSMRHVMSCAVYSFSLFVLYMSSTLFHSFFALKTTRYIFNVFDHCAIYILIAGSYTPFLSITFPDNILWSGYLLSLIWVCCICGIFVDATLPNWKYKSRFSLTMYLSMGWCCMICVPDLLEELPQEAIALLVLGGVLYTAGVPFFVRNNNLDHSIWHCFVLAASICHWIAVYEYVAMQP